MSKLLKSAVSRVATTAAPATPASAVSTMLALGATRWIAFGLRVAVVGLVSAGATALDAQSGASQDPAQAPAAMVAEASPRSVAPPVAPVEGAVRDEAPIIEQVSVPPVADRMASRSAPPAPRAGEPRKDGPESSDQANRQGENEVLKLIRRGYGLNAGGASNTPR